MGICPLFHETNKWKTLHNNSMGRSDRLWHFPLTAELHHLYEKESERTVDEEIVKRLLAESGEHVVVDLGIGAGRELEWLRESPTTSRVIGVDYSTRMLRKGMELWKGFEKKLVFVDDDITKLSNLAMVIGQENQPCYYISLANTLGNLEYEERAQAFNRVASVMKPADRLVAVLYKMPKSKRGWSEEIEYYKKNFPIYERIVWEMFKTPIHYSYDTGERNVVFGTQNTPICISHRWTKQEIKELCRDSGLLLEYLYVGKYAYIPICKSEKK